MEPLPVVCGQIRIVAEEGGFLLSHRGDGADGNYYPGERARTLSMFDESGNFRPLKTAPNLVRGWKIRLGSWPEVGDVLEQFYPGRRGVRQAFERGKLRPTPLRETLARQTGMYRVAAQITDEQIDEVVTKTCRSDGGCLRAILWRRDANGAWPSAGLPRQKYEAKVDPAGQEENVLPLLCQEACAILLGSCRAAVKS